jgi:hypothetical protein
MTRDDLWLLLTVLTLFVVWALAFGILAKAIF